MSTNAELLEFLSPETRQRLDKFEIDKAAYIETQGRYTGLINGNADLLQRAAQLESTANAAEADWKIMAKSPTSEQSEINAEIERIGKLRTEAGALRLTASARDELKPEMLLQLIEMRGPLSVHPSLINKECWRGQLDQVLSQAGLRESLLQAFTLSRALYIASGGPTLQPYLTHWGREAALDRGIWDAFRKELEQLFLGAEKMAEAPDLAPMPARVAEERQMSAVELQKLRRSVQQQ